MPYQLIYVFDLSGVLIWLDVGRCMRAFEALMGEETRCWAWTAVEKASKPSA